MMGEVPKKHIKEFTDLLGDPERLEEIVAKAREIMGDHIPDEALFSLLLSTTAYASMTYNGAQANINQNRYVQLGFATSSAKFPCGCPSCRKIHQKIEDIAKHDVENLLKGINNGK